MKMYKQPKMEKAVEVRSMEVICASGSYAPGRRIIEVTNNTAIGASAL